MDIQKLGQLSFSPLLTTRTLLHRRSFTAHYLNKRMPKSSRESGGGRHMGHLETRLQNKISRMTKNNTDLICTRLAIS